jgi:hypothetical protein
MEKEALDYFTTRPERNLCCKKAGTGCLDFHDVAPVWHAMTANINMLKRSTSQFVNRVETFSTSFSSTIIRRGVGRFGEIVVIFRCRFDWDRFAVFHFGKI